MSLLCCLKSIDSKSGTSVIGEPSVLAYDAPIIHESGFAEKVRFNEVKKKLLAISATSIGERLKELEQRGVVQRRMYL